MKNVIKIEIVKCWNENPVSYFLFNIPYLVFINPQNGKHFQPLNIKPAKPFKPFPPTTLFPFLITLAYFSIVFF
jgi:hypothetical protein